MAHAATLPVLLRQLKLSTVAQLWEPFLTRAQEERWTPAEYLAALCEYELNERESRRIARFIKQSRLPVGKTLASFEFSKTPDVQPEKLQAFAANSDWVKRAENILFFGPSGVGKTHLAAAIGYALVEQSVRVRYYTATSLVQELQKARAELNLENALGKLDKYPVLILDDLGYVKKSEAETHVLFELIAHRYETGSLIITSNQPFSEWDKIFAEPAMTVAAIDRVVHHASIIEIGGESYRKRQAIAHNSKARQTTTTERETSITDTASNRNKQPQS